MEKGQSRLEATPQKYGELQVIRVAPSGKTTCLSSRQKGVVVKRYPCSSVVSLARLEAFPGLHREGLLVPLREVFFEEDSVVFVEQRMAQDVRDALQNSSEEDLVAFVVLCAEKLHRFHRAFDFHGNLKPGNIFVVSGSPFEVFLDDPYPGNDYAFWYQDPFAAPEGVTGVPSKESDWWSLGMVLLHIFGRRPFRPPVDIPGDIPPRFRMLLRGLLTRDAAKRWGYGEVLRWARGEEVPLVGDEEVEPGKECFFLGDVPVWTPEEFAYLVTKSKDFWVQGKKALREGRFLSWLYRTGENGLTEDLKRILREEPDDDRALLWSITRLNPRLPFVFCGRVLACFGEEKLDIVPLAHFLERWIGAQEVDGVAQRIVQEVVRECLFSAYLRQRGAFEFLPQITACEEQASRGETLEEQARMYCAALLGRPEVVSILEVQRKRYRARELYAQVREVLYGEGSPIARCNALFDVLYGIFDAGEFPEEFDEEFDRAQAAFRRMTREGKSQEMVLYALCSLALRVIARMTGIAPPEEFQGILHHRFAEETLPAEETVDFFGLVVQRVQPGPHQDVTWVLVTSPEYGKLSFCCSGLWKDIAKALSPGDVISVLSARKGRKERVYSAGASSVLILEPGFLVELSDLAQAFGSREEYDNPWLFFVDRLLPREKNPRALYGSTLASFLAQSFDSNLSPGELLHHVLFEDPLRILVLVLQEGNTFDVQSFERRILEDYRRFQEFLRRHSYEDLLSEEIVFSERVGLIGRVDLLLKQGHFWRVVEIKSGTPPRNNRPWAHHLMQVVGYHAIADVLGKRLLNEAIVFYADAPTSFEGDKRLNIDDRMKRRLHCVRNLVVLFWRRFENHPLETLEHLLSKDASVPSYLKEAFEELREVFCKASRPVRAYYAQMLAFLLREERLIRSEISLESARLLRQSSRTRYRNSAVLRNLRWNRAASQPEDGLFAFEVCANSSSPEDAPDFRAGDRVLLVPQNVQDGEEPFFLSGYLEEMDSVQIVLRTLFPRPFLYHLTKDPERLFLLGHGVSSKHVDSMRMLAYFLKAPGRKQELLLGLRRPTFHSQDIPLPEDLFKLRQEQQDILRNALKAQDYFLIQGPPGTGKTKVVLANLVRLLLGDASCRILLLAFTNRAVDEMCAAIQRYVSPGELLRLGSSTDYEELVPRKVLAGKDLQSILQRFRNIRVLASTIDSCMGSWELVEAFKPEVAIVDEASQILEAHIVGILSSVKRFILIGDERQLPAVVMQKGKHLEVHDTELRTLGITRFDMSLFERLLRNAQRNKWHECYASLRAQGRMHRDIQDLANALAYGGRLELLDVERQTAPLCGYPLQSQDLFERLLTRSRVLFIPVCRGYDGPRTNRIQAELVCRFVRAIRNVLGFEKDIGVIAPFRAQVYAIREALVKMPEMERSRVHVDTVERFQGGERDVIILSLSVRSPQQLRYIQSLPSEPFLEEPEIIDRKLNVAITRAREYLIILGNPVTLNRLPQYRDLLEHIRQQGGYVDNIPDLGAI